MTLSVVIPTKDRAETLRRNLERLRRQVPPPGGFEVVVVDNGSTDDTATVLERAVEGFGGQLVVVAEPKPGPASARNAGVRASSGALILFMGDDMLPAGDDLLLRHAQLHEDDPDPTYAILGRVEWVAEPTVTPFMRWLDRGGPQFAFFRFEPGVVDARGYFYTSQVSLKKALFESVGGFDERFPYAALEDVDLGVRLADAGLRLEYHPELLVYHDHPTTTRAAAERARLVGRSAALYAELHPERPLPGFEPLPPISSAAHGLAQPVLRALAKRGLPDPLQRRVWRAMVRASFDRGYRDGSPGPSGSGAVGRN